MIEFIVSFTKKGITKRVYIYADRYEGKSFANKHGNVIDRYIMRLIASSRTKENLQKIVDAYFYGNCILEEGGKILNSSRTGHLKCFKWEVKGKRYRLVSQPLK